MVASVRCSRLRSETEAASVTPVETVGVRTCQQWRRPPVNTTPVTEFVDDDHCSELSLVFQVVLACLSSEFADDDHCSELFSLAKRMQKVIQVVHLGTDRTWMKTTGISIQVTTEVCIMCMYICTCYQLRSFSTTSCVFNWFSVEPSADSIVNVVLWTLLCKSRVKRVKSFLNYMVLYRVSQKAWPVLKCCSSCIWWLRNMFYTPYCSVLYIKTVV